MINKERVELYFPVDVGALTVLNHVDECVFFGYFFFFFKFLFFALFLIHFLCQEALFLFGVSLLESQHGENV